MQYKKLPKRARYAMLIADLITLVLVTVIILIIKTVLASFLIPPIINEILTYLSFIMIAFLIVELILTQLIAYPRIKYLIVEDRVEVMKGLHFIEHSIIPMRRMQQISIEEGPIIKLFGLAEVVIITAGGRVEIKHNDKEEALQISLNLQTKINSYVKAYQSAEALSDE